MVSNISGSARNCVRVPCRSPCGEIFLTGPSGAAGSRHVDDRGLGELRQWQRAAQFCAGALGQSAHVDLAGGRTVQRCGLSGVELQALRL